MDNYEVLVGKVIDWAAERGIFNKGDVLAQLDKTQEELDETILAVKEYRTSALDQESISKAEDEVADGIGDMLVTIIIAARMVNLDTTYCLQMAYDEIKNRTGKMVGGQFVKDK